MSAQPFPQLQQAKHKDSIKDKLEGVLTTVSKIPALIHADTSKELTGVTSALAARHAAHSNTKASLDALPAELASFDQVLDDTLARAHHIIQSLNTLRAFSNRQQHGQPLGSRSSQQPPKQHPPRQWQSQHPN